MNTVVAEGYGASFFTPLRKIHSVSSPVSPYIGIKCGSRFLVTEYGIVFILNKSVHINLPCRRRRLK